MIGRTAVLLFLTTTSVFSQDAKVVTLSDLDAKEAKVKYEALKKAQQEWDAEQEKIKKAYVFVGANDSDRADLANGTMQSCSNGFCTETPVQGQPSVFFRKGFDVTDGEFEFSSDFKYIVPRQRLRQVQPCYNFQYQYTPTPAFAPFLPNWTPIISDATSRAVSNLFN